VDADNIRTLFEYHFALNRRVWDECISALTDEQFTRDLAYSLGAIRNQTVHMMSVDQRWLARLRQMEVPASLKPLDFLDRSAVRVYWDRVEADIRAYLSGLTDADLTAIRHYPTSRRGPSTSEVWQILVHVVNHGTDHRAQLLAMLFQLGAPTLEQDMMLYWWDTAAN
jgi:uncharacterized damage-inducible protein DinB